MSYLRPNSSKQSLPSRPNSSRPISSKSNINPERREKLKWLLYEKYKKKFGRLFPEKEVKNELDNFMNKEQLSEKELKQIDKKIEQLVIELQNKNTLYQNLKADSKSNNQSSLKENMRGSNISNYSRSKQNDIGYQDENFREIVRESKLPAEDDNLSYASHQRPINRMEFDKGGEWNAIAEFNRDDFKNQQQQKKIKDKETKENTKQELNRQMEETKQRKLNERTHDLAFGSVILRNVEYLTKIEQERHQIEKEKGLREKQIRDKQLKENKQKLKNEFKNQRDFDNQLLAKVKKETEEEEKKLQRKKQEKHEELVLTLKENEINKKIQLEKQEKERQEDIQAQIEYGKMLDKQEKERADYFKDRERKGNTFISLMVENVIKEQEMKNQKLDETIRRYQQQKDQM